MSWPHKATPLATIGVLSIGDMGVGIARRLKAAGFAVVTNCEGRSQDTKDRAQAAGVQLLATDLELVNACDVLLSVVPPRDALAIVSRIEEALAKDGARGKDTGKTAPLYLADMNAIAPETVRLLASSFPFPGSDKGAVFVDGCIIGGPPAAPQDAADSAGDLDKWYLPHMPLSGPAAEPLLTETPYGHALARALNMYTIGPSLGAASGLKMCFASMSKGYTAIALQAYTTAQRIGVLGELRDVLGRVAPARLQATEKGLVDMAPKAYRWVREMEEIRTTFEQEGGFDTHLFQGVANVYRTVTNQTVLGEEKIGKRKRGTTAEDVAVAMVEGMVDEENKKKRRPEGK